MKNLFKYIATTCLGVITLNSCSDDDNIIKLNPASFVAPKVTSTATTVDLNEATQTETAYIFEWTAADYGVQTPPSYSIQIIKEGDDFNNAKELTSVQTTTFEVDGTTLNTFVVEQLELEPNTEATIQYRIASSLGTFGSQPLYSETRSVTLTPFSTNLSTTWGVVGAFNGWGATPDAPFWKTNTPGILEAYANLQPDDDGFIKFKVRENNSWDAGNGNLGGTVTSTSNTGFEGTLSASEGDIVAPKAGNYKITIDLNNNTYKAEFFQWGLVGDATPNGWDGPDTQILTFDGINEVWYANNVVLKKGLFKVRQNNKWEIDYGGANNLLEKGGNNISIEAGTYNLIFDFEKLTYSITPVN